MPITISKEKIRKLTIFFAKDRISGMPYLDEMLMLDDFWNSTYDSNRRFGFRDAKLKANEKVITHILLSDEQSQTTQ